MKLLDNATNVELPTMNMTYPAYNTNLQEREKEFELESQEYGGQFVARSIDGVETLAYAETRERLRELLNSKGVERSKVVFAYVPKPDEAEIF